MNIEEAIRNGELNVVTEQGMFGELGLEDPNLRKVKNKKIKQDVNKNNNGSDSERVRNDLKF
jgi:hypothetical protein